MPQKEKLLILQSTYPGLNQELTSLERQILLEIKTSSLETQNLRSNKPI